MIMQHACVPDQKHNKGPETETNKRFRMPHSLPADARVAFSLPFPASGLVLRLRSSIVEMIQDQYPLLIGYIYSAMDDEDDINNISNQIEGFVSLRKRRDSFEVTNHRHNTYEGFCKSLARNSLQNRLPAHMSRGMHCNSSKCRVSHDYC